VHSWDTYGLPELLVCDNAKQYYSASFDEACLQLGIVTQYAPVRHPYYKPSVERVFGGINTRLLHQTPGTTFSSISDKWDYDPKKNAVISMDVLERLLHNWIVDVYQRSHHRGIDDVPARRWEVGTKKFPPALPFSAKELNILLGHIEHRVISNSGIELFGGLYYNDSCLSALRVGAKKGQKFKIKYDPMDISIIHVYDSRTNDYLAVPAVDQDYTKGLTLWQHKVIKREARSTVEEYVDIVELSLAKDRIKKIVAEGFNPQSKSGTNVRAAQWLGIGQDQHGRLEISDPEANTNQVERPTTSESAARLSPHSNATAGISNFPSAMSASGSAGSDTAIERGASGVETEQPAISKKANTKNSDRRRRRDANSSTDSESQGLDTQENTNTSAPHESSESRVDAVTLTNEEDIVLEGWESGYDLPRRSR
jgi:putative transposase